MKKILALLIVGMFCMTFASAVWYLPWTWFDNPENNTQQEGKLFITNIGQEWNTIKATEEESNLIFWTANAKDKKTELGWIPPSGCLGWDDKYIYNNLSQRVLDNKDKDIKLKCESSKCDGQDCYHISLTEAQAINIDEYVKLGENSFITEYQDINILNYDLGWSDTNVTLFKNISGLYSNTVNSIWIKYNNDSYKFGANDSSNEDIESYKYQIKSDIPIYLDNWVAYIKNPEKIMNKDYSYTETHDFDFNDICNRHFNEWNTTEEIEGEEYTITHWNDSADCEFEMYNVLVSNETEEICDIECYNQTTIIYDYYTEVTFISDKDIDPEITIGSDDWAVTSLLTNVTAEAGNFTHLDISNDAPYDSLILYMPMDVNTSSVYDWSDTGNDGTINGPIFNTTDCHIGGCYSFDGTGKSINTPGDILNTTEAFSVSAWFNPIDIISSAKMIAGDGSNSFQIYRSNDDIAFKSNSTLNAANILPSANKWYNLVVTSNGTFRAIYIDGALSIEGSYVPQDGTNTIAIGAYITTGGFDWEGNIDEVMIFNQSLNSTQILELYNNQSARFLPEGTQKVRAVNISNSTTWDDNGFNRVNLTSTVQENLDSRIEARIGQFNFSVDPEGLLLYMPFEWGTANDISGFGNDGAITGAVFNESGGVNETGGFEFDGTTDNVNLGDMTDVEGIDSITLSAWVKTTSGQSANNYIFGKSGAGSDSFNLFWTVTENIQLTIYNTSAVGSGSFKDGILVADTWTHVVGVYNGTNVLVYVNGVEGESVGSLTGIIANTAHDFMIGYANVPNQGWNGTIDEVMVFNRSLTPTEISQMYNDSVAKYNTAYYTDYQNITSDTAKIFTISKEADFVFPEYKFLVGPNSSASFYSPIIQDNIIGSFYTEHRDVYYSVGTNSSDLKSGSPTLDIVDGLGLFSVAQDNKIGVGDEVTYGGSNVSYISGRINSTAYYLVDNLGYDMPDVSGSSVDSIERAFNYLSLAETGADELLGGSDLTVLNVSLNLACYADGVDNGAAAVIGGWTTGALNYIKIYTPVNSSEVGVSQRHSGIWSTSGYILNTTGGVDTAINIIEDFVFVSGLQLSTNDSGNENIVDINAGVGSRTEISYNIIRGIPDGNTGGIGSNGANNNVSIYNNIIYDNGRGFVGGTRIVGGFAVIQQNTYVRGDEGVVCDAAATCHVFNNICQNTGDDCYRGVFQQNGSNIANDTTSPNDEFDSVSVVFVDIDNDNFNLDESDIYAIDNGTDLSASVSQVIFDDVNGTSRPQGSGWDIGAFEYVASGDNPPTYSDIAVNSTLAGYSTNFSITWDDDVALEDNGQYIFSTNNTGVWVNESAVNFTSTPESVYVIKTLNSTEGLSIGYRWYGTDNTGNEADTGILTLTTTDYHISIVPIYPTGNINVTQNEFFNVSFNVTCLTGNCGTINVSLDPLEIGTNAGFVTVAPTGDPGGTATDLEWKSIAILDTTPIGVGKITEIGFWSATSTFDPNDNELEVGIYEDTGSGYPGALVGVSTGHVVGGDDWNKWVRVTGLNIPITEETNYWIAVFVEIVSSADVRVDSANLGGTGRSQIFPSSGLASPWGSTDTGDDYMSFYAVVEESSSTAKSGLINTTEGATPFYTNSTNPFTTSSLSEGQSEIVNFWVNATGEVDVTHDFFAWANMTTNESVSNVTDHWNVTIVDGAEDTCTYTSGNWEVDCADNCIISSPVDIGGNDIFITGTGTFRTSSDIFNYGLLHIEGTDSSNICRVGCYGGCFK